MKNHIWRFITYIKNSIVREIEEDKLFLISRYVIDVMQYHTNSKRMNWYNSEIRKWFNSDFIQNSFEEGLSDVLC